MYVHGITALTVIINSTRGERGSGGEADCGGGDRKKVIKLSSRVAGLCLRQHRGGWRRCAHFLHSLWEGVYLLIIGWSIIIRRLLKYLATFRLGVALSITKYYR